MTECRFAFKISAVPPIAVGLPPRPAVGEHFLGVPIPRGWLNSAMALPGKALHVGVEIWYRAGMTKRCEVVLSLAAVARVGHFDRATASRALGALESVGLVRVTRHAGRAPRVMILEQRPVSGERGRL